MSQSQPTSDRDPAISSNGLRGCVFILGNQMEPKISDTGNPNHHELYAQEMLDLWKNEIDGCRIFQDDIHLNLCTNGIENAVKDLSTMKNTSEFDYLVVVISAEGSLQPEGEDREYRPHIKGSNGKWYSESKMLASFFNHNKTWQGKPKLFILNYCRFAKTSEAYVAKDTSQSKGTTPEISTGEKKKRDTNQRIPTISDVTLVYGSSSRLLSVIKQVFSAQWQSKSLLQMLTAVNEKMSSEGYWSVFESSQETIVMLTADGISDKVCQEYIFSADDIGIFRGEVDRFHRKAKDISDDEMVRLLGDLISKVGPRLHQRPTGPVPTLSKGCALVISNAIANGDKSHTRDKDMMENLWVKNGLCELFDAESHVDKTATEMWKLCEKFSNTATENYDYAVIIISSHGGLIDVASKYGDTSPHMIKRPHIAGHGQDTICERDLLELFNRDESTWHGKVKIFILDYCRGRDDDKGHAKTTWFEEFQYNEDELPPDISTVVDDSIIVYATQARFTAYAQNGLITAISTVFGDDYRSKSILEMLADVNRQMKNRTGHIAMSLFKSTLTKDYYLLAEADVPSVASSHDEEKSQKKDQMKVVHEDSNKKEEGIVSTEITNKTAE